MYDTVRMEMYCFQEYSSRMKNKNYILRQF